MKFLLITIILFNFSLLKAQTLSRFNFTTDVYQCQHKVFNLYELEKKFGIFGERFDLSFEETNSLEESLLKVTDKLKQFSPARAEVFKKMWSGDFSNIQFKKGLKFTRIGPEGSLLNRSDCTLEVISLFEFTPLNYKIIINENLYQLLSIQGKIYFWLSLYFDFEQAHDFSDTIEFPSNNFDFNIVSSREIIACLENSSCFPKNQNQKNRLVDSDKYKLRFYEQDGILLTNKKGNIKKHPNSDIIYSAQKIHVTNIFPYSFSTDLLGFNFQFFSLYDSVYFDQNAKLRCFTYYQRNQNKEPFYLNYQGQTLSLTSFYDGESFLKPVCVDSKKIVRQGAIQTNINSVVKIKISQKLATFTDPTPLDHNEIAPIVFASNGQPIYFSNLNGQFEFFGNIVETNSPIVLYEDSTPKCFAVSKSVTLKIKGQPDLAIVVKPYQTSDHYCFEKNGKLKSTHHDWILLKSSFLYSNIDSINSDL